MATTNYEDKKATILDNHEKNMAAAEKANNAAKKDALSDVDVQYGNMIGDTEKAYNDAMNKVGVQDANGNWNKGSMAQIQTDISNKQLDFAIDEIERHKEQAHKDYLKEQSASYVDWQKQSNKYGANAEQWAASGLAGSGYSESSLVSMYNTHQNRVATARASYELVVQNYNSDITNARLQNDARLAEIAFETLSKGLELSLGLITEKNKLVADKAAQKMQVEQMYQNKWLAELQRLNADREVELDALQAERAHDLQQQELDLAKDKWDWEKEQASKNVGVVTGGGSGGGGSGGGSGKKTTKSTVTSTTSKVKPNGSKTAGGDKKNVSTENSENNLPVDMDSIIKLGLGPISAQQLDRLVAQGYVMEYKSGGKIAFKWTAAGLKNKMMFPAP